MVCPVMYAAPSDVRKDTVVANSSGYPSLPTGALLKDPVVMADPVVSLLVVSNAPGTM